MPDEIIPDALIEKVGKRLAEGRSISVGLPSDGRLHIERPFPYLVVYRRPVKTGDAGTEQLVKGEASYLIVSGASKASPGLSRLLNTIADSLTIAGEPFLIVEIWAGSGTSGTSPEIPGYCIYSPQSSAVPRTVKKLTASLTRIGFNRIAPEVKVVYRNRCAPDNQKPLTGFGGKASNFIVIGLEITPVYRDPESGTIFPLLLKKMHRAVSRAIKEAVFEFLRNRSHPGPGHYLALGRRTFSRAVWDVDKRLAEISDSFDFLLQVSPVNTESAWTEFKKNRFEKAPVFHYRPSPVDPSIVKRELYRINIEDIDDPALSSLFHEKRLELDRKLTMLLDLETPRFVYGSLQLYGGLSQDFIDIAENMLTELSPRSRDETGKACVGAAAFADRARQEMAHYRKAIPDLSGSVQIRDDVSGLIVSKDRVLVGSNVSIPQSRVEALIQHEVGTHFVTYTNGKAQPFRQLAGGLAGYEETQEGLAVIAEYLTGGLSRPRLRLLAGRLIAANLLLRGASFIETFRELNRTHHFTQYSSFMVASRIYRGGGLTKDAIYLRGLIEILKFISGGADLGILYYGKVSLAYVPLIEELLHRQVLAEASLRPRYLQNPLSLERLESLKKGMNVLDLVRRD